jgi:hypothetical protein
VEPVQIQLALGAVTHNADEKDPHGGLDFAWHVHSALDSWTGKVDSKASITLAIESATVGFVLTLSKKGQRLAGLEGASSVGYHVGLACLLIAVLFSLLVVVPQLRRRQARGEWRKGMVYFGHLRHWDPAELASALKAKQKYEDQLANQLVTMSKIAWRKHARLQWSIAFLVLGSACLLFAVVNS